ncbi:MAG: aldo/keto reductase [Acidobacteria bacterium]|nr:aldo/keto reductase [Acidobacteriota bacterium]
MLPEGLIFGGWPMGGWHWSNVDEKTVIRAAIVAAEAGITWFDTAPVYGFGMGEERLGRALKSIDSPVYIMTKFGLRWDTDGVPFFETTFNGQKRTVVRNLSPESIRNECEASLKRLKVDSIDLYQLHWNDDRTIFVDMAGVLVRLKEEGKIREWGVCNLNTGTLHLLVSAGLKPASLQFQYSLLNRKPEKSLIPYCRKHNIRFLAYSPLGRGLLTGNASTQRIFEPEDDRKYWKPEKVADINRKLTSLAPMAKQYDISIPALVLSWTLNQPGVSGVIAAARTPAQAAENAKAASVPLVPDDLSRISEWAGRTVSGFPS